MTVMLALPASRIAERTASGIASFSAQEKSTINTDSALDCVPGEGKAQDTPRKGVGHQPVGKAGRLAFGLRLHLFGLLDHADDLVVTALTGGLLYFKNAFAFFHNGSGIKLPRRGAWVPEWTPL